MPTLERPAVSRSTRVILVAILILAVVLAVVLSLSRPAHAQGSPDTGRELARMWCANCHLADPAAQPRAGDAVPSFPSIARRPGVTRATLDTFLQKPHGGMPDFSLGQQQIDDVVAYLLSMRPR